MQQLQYNGGRPSTSQSRGQSLGLQSMPDAFQRNQLPRGLNYEPSAFDEEGQARLAAMRKRQNKSSRGSGAESSSSSYNKSQGFTMGQEIFISEENSEHKHAVAWKPPIQEDLNIMKSMSNKSGQSLINELQTFNNRKAQKNKQSSRDMKKLQLKLQQKTAGEVLELQKKPSQQFSSSSQNQAQIKQGQPQQLNLVRRVESNFIVDQRLENNVQFPASQSSINNGQQSKPTKNTVLRDSKPKQTVNVNSQSNGTDFSVGQNSFNFNMLVPEKRNTNGINGGIQVSPKMGTISNREFKNNAHKSSQKVQHKVTWKASVKSNRSDSISSDNNENDIYGKAKKTPSQETPQKPQEDDAEPKSSLLNTLATDQDNMETDKLENSEGDEALFDQNRYLADSSDKSKRCVIHQNNHAKLHWDLFIMSLLVVISFMLPYRLAFSEKDTSFIAFFYLFMDSCFFIDIVLTFFTTVTDNATSFEVAYHPEIAKRYISSWFFIDVVSILPFEQIFASWNVGDLFRFARISKLYKLIRMTRLARLFKLLKSNKTVISHLTEKLQISAGLERLLFFVVFFIFFLHISACMYILLVQFEEHEPQNWLTPYQFSQDFEVYTLSIYFVLTTISTVGYGDVKGGNTTERVFCMILMVIGVSCFSFISGALASIMSTYDTSQAALQEKLLFLNKLKATCHISEGLYDEIRRALNFDQKQNRDDLHNFIESLPLHLRLDLSMEVHKEDFQKFDLFQKIGNKHFLTWIGQNLKPQYLSLGQKVYQEGDDIDQFFFMISGKAAFMIPRQNNMIFAAIDPDEYVEQQGSKKKVFQFFGLEDSIYNHCKLMLTTQKQEFAGQGPIVVGEKLLSKRKYCVQVYKGGEALTLTNKIIDRMRRDYQVVARKFFKIMIQQFKIILAYHCHCLQRFNPNRVKPKQISSPTKSALSNFFSKKIQEKLSAAKAEEEKKESEQEQISINELNPDNCSEMMSSIPWSNSMQSIKYDQNSPEGKQKDQDSIDNQNKTPKSLYLEKRLTIALLNKQQLSNQGSPNQKSIMSGGISLAKLFVHQKGNSPAMGSAKTQIVQTKKSSQQLLQSPELMPPIRNHILNRIRTKKLKMQNKIMSPKSQQKGYDEGEHKSEKSNDFECINANSYMQDSNSLVGSQNQQPQFVLQGSADSQQVQQTGMPSKPRKQWYRQNVKEQKEGRPVQKNIIDASPPVQVIFENVQEDPIIEGTEFVDTKRFKTQKPKSKAMFINGPSSSAEKQPNGKRRQSLLKASETQFLDPKNKKKQLNFRQNKGKNSKEIDSSDSQRLSTLSQDSSEEPFKNQTCLVPPPQSQLVPSVKQLSQNSSRLREPMNRSAQVVQPGKRTFKAPQEKIQTNKVPIKWKLSPEEVNHIQEQSNKATTPMMSLAIVLRLAQQSKIKFELNNPDAVHSSIGSDSSPMPRMARRLKETLVSRLQEVNMDQEIGEIIRNQHYDILTNLIDEQKFRCKLNSVGNDGQDLIQSKLKEHTQKVTQMVKQLDEGMQHMQNDVLTIKQQVSRLKSSIHQVATNKPMKRYEVNNE